MLRPKPGGPLPGALCPGALCPGGPLPREKVAQGALCPGGKLPRGDLSPRAYAFDVWAGSLGLLGLGPSGPNPTGPDLATRLGFGPEGPKPKLCPDQTQQAQSLGRHVVTIPRAGLGDARRQFSNLGSFQTWAVFKPGQLSHWGSCHPGAVVFLGSCPT